MLPLIYKTFKNIKDLIFFNLKWFDIWSNTMANLYLIAYYGFKYIFKVRNKSVKFQFINLTKIQNFTFFYFKSRFWDFLSLFNYLKIVYYRFLYIFRLEKDWYNLILLLWPGAKFYIFIFWSQILTISYICS